VLAFRFANGLFEPIWNRNFIAHVQIDVPETLGLGTRAAFYEATGAFRDMVVTHLFQILAFVAMEPPPALEPSSISEEKNKVFRSILPIDPHDVVRGQYNGYRAEQGVSPDSETETFIALKCSIDNWRWAGVPFFLRTGKRLAEGQRIISIAFREPPKSMFPADSGVGAQGPDHLTFDLADASKMSLSFYGKRPGPGMRLDKLSLQFAMRDTGLIGDVLEDDLDRLAAQLIHGHIRICYRRLIHELFERDRLSGEQRRAPAEAGRESDLGIFFGHQAVEDQLIEAAIEVAATVKHAFGHGQLFLQAILIRRARPGNERGHVASRREQVGEYRQQLVAEIGNVAVSYVDVEHGEEGLEVRHRSAERTPPNRIPF